MDKIAFLEANINIVERTESLLAEQIKTGEVIVHQVGVRTIEKEARELVKAGVQAIIARGGTYQDLAEVDLGIPVIRMVISASDILLALNHAARRYKKVKLVLHESIVFEPQEYNQLIPIEVERYRYRGIVMLEELLDSLELDEDTVLVGSGAIKELSSRKYMDFINVLVQDSTFLQTYYQAKQILEQTRQEVQRVRLLESILYSVNDGVAIIGMDGKILHFNRRCEELTGISEGEAQRKEVKEVLPGYPLASYLQMNRDDSKELIMEIRNRKLAVSTSLFPLEPSGKQLILTIQDVTRLQKMEQNIRYILAKKGLTAEYHFNDIKTRDERMKKVIDQARKISRFPGSVLIYGESGTGKELIAQSIHNESDRSAGPFVAVNCAAISESLLESELFGYVGGAFTGARKEGKAGMFELAHKGTVFLDEINSMPLNLQAKLLRVIEQREVMRVGSDYVIPLDVRIIAAGNRKLSMNVQEGAFRHDLYFRLNTFELTILPLNERSGDILYLFREFLAEYEEKTPAAIQLTPEFENQLLGYNWLGNVRELRNTALRYHVYQGDNSNQEILPKSPVGVSVVTEDLKIDLKELNKTVEELVIQSMLEQNMTKTDVAKALGISRQALFKKMNQDSAMQRK